MYTEGIYVDSAPNVSPWVIGCVKELCEGSGGGGVHGGLSSENMSLCGKISADDRVMTKITYPSDLSFWGIADPDKTSFTDSTIPAGVEDTIGAEEPECSDVI